MNSLSLLLLLASAWGADSGQRTPAAPPNAAQWSVSGLPMQPIEPGSSFALTLSAQIRPGWHIYALEEPDGGPLPTQIGLAEGDPLILLSIDEPHPSLVPDPVLRQPTGIFGKAVAFTLRVRAPRTPLTSAAVSHILVRYQSCSDRLCLPPHTEDLAVPLRKPPH